MGFVENALGCSAPSALHGWLSWMTVSKTLALRSSPGCHIWNACGNNAAAGYGYRVTWGPQLPLEPLLPWLGIPLDHTLVSPHIKVNAADIGETPGSDHRWQRVRIQF